MAKHIHTVWKPFYPGVREVKIEVVGLTSEQLTSLLNAHGGVLSALAWTRKGSRGKRPLHVLTMKFSPMGGLMPDPESDDLGARERRQ